ncbi:helicase-related protein [Demequina pelophila]|uniref:helicase-related protein n=1 Tax=Demequina pelophila TaxID=1638984 RepID=UPI00078241CE|nr:helicase-related protein [Demequina pelophila]
MTLTAAQAAALDHLRKAYVGPEGGDRETLLNRPHLQYTVGMLFPPETDAAEEVTDADVPEGDVEEVGALPRIAEDWRPSSVAISFVTDLPRVVCSVRAATYELTDGEPSRWQRVPFELVDVVLSDESTHRRAVAGAVPVEVGSRWRRIKGGFLVTVHFRARSAMPAEPRLESASVLYQVGLEVKPDPAGAMMEYSTAHCANLDDEAEELRFRFRNRKVYAAGHGMAANWREEEGICTSVFLEPVPAFVTPAIKTTAFEPGAAEERSLGLDFLAAIDTDPAEVLAALEGFADAFETWVRMQEARAAAISGADGDSARRIASRSATALTRMRSGIGVLRKDEQIRRAFALGMAAMRLQMRQSSFNRSGTPGEPRWRPFQLGFLLVALASTTDDSHADRELVDLIWFPTGGGKTEAYLGLASVEVFRRRIMDGVTGGGTAVITRYTLRLLTSQQFERAAALICAMELLRRRDERARGMAPFSIGLWVGNDVTPPTLARARSSLERLRKARRPQEANEFQVQSCPWCQAPLVPVRASADEGDYGFRRMGHEIVIHCPSKECEFADELPLAVIDEVLYRDPPTILLATVDKFARLQFKAEAGALLGLRGIYKPPSLIVQDELHLLSGPLGTTVAVFDAVLQVLLASRGSSPKVIASTATIRSASEQIKGLYGRASALYPPSGLDDDRTFFSEPVDDGSGRLYVGLMPQSSSQASALVSAAAPLFEIPHATQAHAGQDAYWTAVLYHNSLRELGRTGTLLLDDVNRRATARAARLDVPLRQVRGDRVLELTSRRGPEELPKYLRALERRVEGGGEAVDAVLSSNMLSVGIDISRLALMLMVGQPKTTAEYIQATSRVGRGSVNGVVVTLFRSNRARDRSHFETFRGYHESLYRSVEPTSVTPWSLASRDRSLAGALVAVVRQSLEHFGSDESAVDFALDDLVMRAAVERLSAALLERIGASDEAELADSREQLEGLLRDWDRRAGAARAHSDALRFERRGDEPGLLKRFGQDGEGWLVGDSMRSVEPNVAVHVQEPNEEASREASGA